MAVLMLHRSFFIARNPIVARDSTRRAKGKRGNVLAYRNPGGT